MEKEKIIYQVRAHKYEYDNNRKWETGISTLSYEFNDEKEAQEQLRITNIKHYYGKAIFQYIMTKDYETKSQKLISYLSDELGIEKNALKNNINFELNGISFKQAEQIYEIIQIDFCFIKKVSKDEMLSYAFSMHILDWEEGGNSWLLNAKFESYEDAINHVIHKVILYYIGWKKMFNLEAHKDSRIVAVTGPTQYLSSNSEYFLKFMKRSKYFSFADNHIEISEIPEPFERTSIITFRSGEKEEITFIDYAEDVKEECRELIAIIREGNFFELERI